MADDPAHYFTGSMFFGGSRGQYYCLAPKGSVLLAGSRGVLPLWGLQGVIFAGCDGCYVVG